MKKTFIVESKIGYISDEIDDEEFEEQNIIEVFEEKREIIESKNLSTLQKKLLMLAFSNLN